MGSARIYMVKKIENLSLFLHFSVGASAPASYNLASPLHGYPVHQVWKGVRSIIPRSRCQVCTSVSRTRFLALAFSTRRENAFSWLLPFGWC